MYSDGPTSGSAAEANEDQSLVAKAREGDRFAFDRLVIK
jgi:hypothetical protein